MCVIGGVRTGNCPSSRCLRRSPSWDLKDRHVRERHWKEVREEWGGEGGRSSISKLPKVEKGRRRGPRTKWRPKWLGLKNCRTDMVRGGRRGG